MFKSSHTTKPWIVFAASIAIVAATGAPAAAAEASTDTQIGSLQSFAQAGPLGKRKKRVSPSGERAEAFKQGQTGRVEQRTAVYERAATVEASEVQARLDAGEEAVLNALAEADTAAIADAANQIGAAAGEALANAPGTNLPQEQMDTLVSAAAYAATISAEEVDQLVTAGSLAIKSYEGLDAEQIAANLNEIGNKALELQDAEKMAKRP
ncbi:MAG: hypothetical protein AAFR64_05580 [Pseudomonadota bacterium]